MVGQTRRHVVAAPRGGAGVARASNHGATTRTQGMFCTMGRGEVGDQHGWGWLDGRRCRGLHHVSSSFGLPVDSFSAIFPLCPPAQPSTKDCLKPPSSPRRHFQHTYFLQSTLFPPPSRQSQNLRFPPTTSPDPALSQATGNTSAHPRAATSTASLYSSDRSSSTLVASDKSIV